jgi:hypothetical protein
MDYWALLWADPAATSNRAERSSLKLVGMSRVDSEVVRLVCFEAVRGP